MKDNAEAKFAIKAMKKKEIIDSKHVDHIENEKKILEQLEHPFIVSSCRLSLFVTFCFAFQLDYYGFFQDNMYIYFVTELLKGGDLFTYHRGVGNFNAKQTMFYGGQVVTIFEYL